MYPKSDPILAPEVPDLIIVTAFNDCGLCSNNGMGQTPISWQELKAYSDLNGGLLNSWQARQVISMSMRYCSAVSCYSDDIAADPPYEPEVSRGQMIARGEHHFNNS